MEVALLIPFVAIIGGLSIAAYAIHNDFRTKEMEAKARGMNGEEATSYAGAVDRLEARMNALEAILDDEVPGWRRKFDD